MYKLRGSVAARLALGYGLLVSVSILVVSAVFYFGTIGVLDRSFDGKIVTISNRLIDTYKARPIEELSREINRQLTDGIDTDTEIFLVLLPTGHRVAGNISAWQDTTAPLGQLVDRDIVRDGKTVPARLLIQELPSGGRLIVGRDLREQESIRSLVWTALAIGAGISLLLVLSGALFFRHQIERRIGDIRRIALEIEAGDLTRRIPVSSEDEFGLLNRDINRMLDRIEHLMDGVRHVSNAIAHDLRTPLSRIRSKLDEALRRDMTVDILRDAAAAAIVDIDNLILIFEKLLQIAEAESGMRPESFEIIDLNRIVRDIVELYDATAEEQQVLLKGSYRSAVLATGDRNLLGSALASLIDNAIKYAGPGATVDVGAFSGAERVSIVVRDDGPGISVDELPHVTKRFYRLDQSRRMPGNGLGLSIVAAVAALHGGTLHLEGAVHGLTASIILPHAEAIDDSLIQGNS